ncbi:unnamed protein product [Tuber melanosporum]|uniref:(Perigord truffle) hypothetical protein n=1 Tax=Tuber melanosporum (strain Mel28) TaxID=656061 RepID=D5GIH2_TUBMM|nr:uncharacterized protein GSTUM_00008498001 [Tuber melanosporum]CAZ84315.1 unnamed protein product [Tuber melanosporum]
MFWPAAITIPNCMLKAKITISLDMQFRILAGSPNISDSIMTVIKAIFFTRTATSSVKASIKNSNNAFLPPVPNLPHHGPLKQGKTFMQLPSVCKISERWLTRCFSILGDTGMRRYGKTGSFARPFSTCEGKKERKKKKSQDWAIRLVTLTEI